MIVQRGLFTSEVAEVCEFHVAGTPIAQGSKVLRISGKRVKKAGQTWILNPRAIGTEQTDMATKNLPAHRLRDWRDKIANAARNAMGEREMWEDYVELSADFVFKRPPSHYTGSGKLTRKAAAILFPGKPDTSKVLRAVEDALTGVVYRDDVLIVQYGLLRKRWGNSPGVIIQVTKV